MDLVEDILLANLGKKLPGTMEGKASCKLVIIPILRSVEDKSVYQEQLVQEGLEGGQHWDWQMLSQC